MDLGALFFGIFVGIFIFAFAKACQQTRSIWKKAHTLNNPYLYLIWGEAICNLIFAVTTMLYLNGVIPEATWYYVLAVVLWAIQVELLPQIIANRVALIMTDQRKAKQLKWGLAAAVTAVCLAVLYIWPVAHIKGATPAQVQLNFVFENIEKAFFLIIDLGLNLYFLYLVRYSLIEYGLNKYWRLFKFNACMVVISTALDVLLLGFLSLPNPYVYVQFAPLAYISKLYIELLMARLISKVVRSHSEDRHDWYSTSRDKSHPSNYMQSQGATGTANRGKRADTTSRAIKAAPPREGSSGSDIHLSEYPEPHGITRTIETTIVVDESEDANANAAKDMVYDETDRIFKHSL